VPGAARARRIDLSSAHMNIQRDTGRCGASLHRPRPAGLSARRWIRRGLRLPRRRRDALRSRPLNQPLQPAQGDDLLDRVGQKHLDLDGAGTCQAIHPDQARHQLRVCLLHVPQVDDERSGIVPADLPPALQRQPLHGLGVRHVPGRSRDTAPLATDALQAAQPSAARQSAARPQHLIRTRPQVQGRVVRCQPVEPRTSGLAMVRHSSTTPDPPAGPPTAMAPAVAPPRALTTRRAPPPFPAQSMTRVPSQRKTKDGGLSCLLAVASFGVKKGCFSPSAA